MPKGETHQITMIQMFQHNTTVTHLLKADKITAMFDLKHPPKIHMQLVEHLVTDLNNLNKDRDSSQCKRTEELFSNRSNTDSQHGLKE